MDPEQLDRLVAAHLEAEAAGDISGCVADYAADVEHDLVGIADGPRYGREAAEAFYARLARGLRTDELVPVRAYYGEDFCVVEHEWRGTVESSLLGLASAGQRLAFRVLRIWEFQDGLIGRESIWLDGLGILRQQLMAPQSATAAGD